MVPCRAVARAWVLGWQDRLAWAEEETVCASVPRRNQEFLRICGETKGFVHIIFKLTLGFQGRASLQPNVLLVGSQF